MTLYPIQLAATWEYHVFGMVAGIGLGLLMHFLWLSSGIGFRWLEDLNRG